MSNKRLFQFALFCILILGTAILASAGNLVQNGGFETGDFTGWTLSGNTMHVGVCDVSSCPGNFPPFQGKYAAYFGAIGDTVSISQELATTPGQDYTLSFYLADPQGGTPNYFSVQFGSAQFSFTNFGAAFGWQKFVLTDMATSSQTLLKFTFRQDPAYWFLDNVAVNQGGQGTPEPSTLALFGSGALGLAAFARRRFRK